jgi:hypothetical protein
MPLLKTPATSGFPSKVTVPVSLTVPAGTPGPQPVSTMPIIPADASRSQRSEPDAGRRFVFEG